MRSLIAAGVSAFLIALLITGLFRPKPLDDQLLHLQVEQALPQYSESLSSEPAALQALFLIYADDPVLSAKAHIALLRYPDIARPILSVYGEDSSFRDVLRRYGEDVILPIHYFLNHEIFSLEIMRSLNESARAALNAARGLWSGGASSEADARESLTSEERGRYAIHFIEAEGYDFLGQFVVDSSGQVGWLQTERVLEGINRFFAGGLKGLESKWRRDDDIAASDIGWAAVDVAVGVGAFKVLRMGRAAAGGRTLTFSQRSAVLGAGLWRGTLVGARVVKYGAPVVLAYMAIRHPSLINSLLGSAAEKLGLPVGLVQLVGWTLVLLPVMLLLRVLLVPLAWLLAGVVRLLRWAGPSPRKPAAVRADG